MTKTYLHIICVQILYKFDGKSGFGLEKANHVYKRKINAFIFKYIYKYITL